MSPSIPILDATFMAKGTAEERAAFGQKFLESMTEYGFVKLVNHSVPLPVVEDTFSKIKQFFKLPFDVKRPTINDPKKGQQRGWSPPGEEKTWWLESNTGDVESPRFSDNKESFDCGDPKDKQFPNQWPAESALPGYQATMDQFYYDCGQLCVNLLEVLAAQMNLDPKLFSSKCTNEASTIRINHFPPIDRQTLESGQVSRIWPHNDFGIISLVFPDRTGGLEYEDRENPGTFIPMPYNGDDEVVVIISETFQRWTNGAVRAGLHRVTKPVDMVGDVVPERWSLVYFCKADRHINVGPLKEFVGPERQPLYEDLTALEYQAMRNAVHYPEPVAEGVSVEA
ncbi:Clavaminate synthase-like protein [Mytilinidion resinicola]|uniref:Clavaminate synthase-like protein n=1 Tax=Mytilinidion resinicola TaxID=574789 RepID=A0A6A6Y404_9PEZI|nr:Clavaminate synthase-like protein [Mytilinidion resinicola]KAF2802754.1 Clavaminate synthase-like protein [Mytilinidion resinicola]